MALYDDVRKAIQELIVPELKNLQLEIQSLKVEIRRLDEKIDSLRNEMTAEIKGLRAEMMSEFRRVDSQIQSLEKELHLAIDIRERLAALESKMGS
jgi:uncharacterized protein involved in exopolysaccharide biosynthesis